MSSILTNQSAMVALQTLRGINSNLTQVQAEISTGKKVANAKDSASIWAISKVMESDVKGFKGISESLSLGESTVAVARQASETVTDLLTDIKSKIVAAQEQNVDREKIQTDIEALRGQISSVVGAAQFNGLNLLKGTEDVEVLSSLDRLGDGSVQAANITVNRQDLSTDAGVYGTGASLAANATATSNAGAANGGAGAAFSNAANTMDVVIGGTIVIGEQFNLQVGGTTVSYSAAATTTADVATGLTSALNAAGITDVTASLTGSTITISSTSAFDDVDVNASTTSAAGTFDLNGAGGAPAAGATGSATIAARASDVTFSTTAGVSEGDGYRVTIGSQNFDYVAGKNETFEDVARGLKLAIDAAAVTNISTNVQQDATTGAWSLQVDNDGAALTFTTTGAAGGEATGGLFGLDDIDVTTNSGADAALGNVETLIDNSIDAAAEFGSAQGRIEIQRDFIGKLTDSLKAGIGTLVDADMEEASARLQALQVQQQLGIQSLSIANQSPQSILSLFR